MGKQLSTASMELYSFVSKTFLKALFGSAPKCMKSRGRSTFKEQQVNVDTGNKIFPGYCLTVLTWRFLLPEQVLWLRFLCSRPSLPFLFLLVGQKDQADNQAVPVVWKSQRLYSNQLIVCTGSLWMSYFDLTLDKKIIVHAIKGSWTDPSLNRVIFAYIVCNFFCSCQLW